MNILLHICCAPCAIFPVQELRSSGKQVTGFFFNHNIHPLLEYRKRLETVRDYAALVELEVIYRDEYRLEEFLAAVAGAPEERCTYCYASRLEMAAAEASCLGFDGFSTTLLYSKYQKHDLIVELAQHFALKYGVHFDYVDFRTGWQKGIDLSRKLGLYRQQYCGCIYSEKERYQPRIKQ